jgi:hypothetical protein
MFQGQVDNVVDVDGEAAVSGQARTNKAYAVLYVALDKDKAQPRYYEISLSRIREYFWRDIEQNVNDFRSQVRGQLIRLDCRDSADRCAAACYGERFQRSSSSALQRSMKTRA